MRLHRYMTHAVVVLIALAMSSYTAFDRKFSISVGAGPGTVRAAAANEGASFGDVSLGRDSTIIKPVSIPTSGLPNRKPIAYRVVQGDSLESIALAFNIPMRDITWSNPGMRLPLTAGQSLRLPPVPGAVIVVGKSDSLESLANAYGADPTAILGFNGIRAPQLTAGSVLVIPVDPVPGPNLSTGLPADPIAPGQLLCPIPNAKIIQRFGPTSFALEPSYGGYLHFHSGVDLLAEYGTPIVASAGGNVTAAGPDGLFGIRVEITDSFGLVEIYAHMSEVAVAVGQPIQQGEKVGFVGSTGLSIGSHLHFQLEVGGRPTDPLPLVGC
ncbi:MAG: M23 family metallopeptidase [Chloroflexi bacterium]|nr:MAG: M23 family metallopeptidase [Chloroflexota bacterium]